MQRIKVMAGEPLEANKFCKHLGFQLEGQCRRHGHLANACVKVIGNDVEN